MQLYSQSEMLVLGNKPIKMRESYTVDNVCSSFVSLSWSCSEMDIFFDNEYCGIFAITVVKFVVA